MLTIFICLPIISNASGTVIRNGGEPVLHFLEATRFSLVETLKDIHLDSKIKASFCREESQLTSAQQEFCREYLFSLLDQIIALNTEPNKVAFVLREDPLLVTGPDGKPMPVSARTELGANGPIEFHLDSIKLMAPKVLFHLLNHEFQHKTVFRGKNPTDNEEIGPFQFGRLLIDSVASAITKVAIKKGRIGTTFVLRDSFDCTIQAGGTPVNILTSTPRWFFDESLVNYRFSLSEQPGDPIISTSDTLNSKVVFQLEVTDTNHCEHLDDKSLRQSRIALWRTFNDQKTPAVLISEENLPGVNPLCEKESKVFKADYQTIHFECRYYGSSAN